MGKLRLNTRAEVGNRLFDCLARQFLPHQPRWSPLDHQRYLNRPTTTIDEPPCALFLTLSNAHRWDRASCKATETAGPRPTQAMPPQHAALPTEIGRGPALKFV